MKANSKFRYTKTQKSVFGCTEDANDWQSSLVTP